MRTKIGILLLLFGFITVKVSAQKAQNMSILFDSLKMSPTIRANQFSTKKALQYKRIANGNLYPEIVAAGMYNYSDVPSRMMPVPPNELIQMVQNTEAAQPYSKNILRGIVSASMPIFVKSIYTSAAKAENMYQSAKLKSEIELQKKEAILVGANSNLMFFEKFDEALISKRNSLEKVKELVQLKVKNGRAPESALLKINTSLNDINISIDQLKLNKEKINASIYSLTNIRLQNAVNMTQHAEFVDGDFVVLQPIEKMVEAKRLNARAEKEKLYPALFAQANYVYSHAKAYNNSEIVNNDYTTASLTLKIPIFEKSQYSKIKLSNLEYREQENELNRMRLEIAAEAEQYQNSYAIIKNTIELSKNSVKAKSELRDIAKDSYLSDRLTIEDYLKYEDDLLFEKAKLYQNEAQKWQMLMQLAVIYGNNIENLVK